MDRSITRTIGDELPKETARVRELMKANVRLALAMMESALQRADKAMIEGDVVAMIMAYQDLKGFEC